VIGSAPARCFEAAPRGGDRPDVERADDVVDGDRDRPLCCRPCGHRITDEAYRIEHGGGHEHTFVNPGGYVHTLGCFALAPGVVHVGSPDPAFSWFPGWTWQVAECGQCRAHIGWIYRCAGEQFHGLVLAMLVSGTGDS
jgi:hypothetical protein